jgi:hypothetical protein
VELLLSEPVSEAAATPADTVSEPDVEVFPLDLDEFLQEQQDTYLHPYQSSSYCSYPYDVSGPFEPELPLPMSDLFSPPRTHTLTMVEIAEQLEQLGLHDHLCFAVQRPEAHMKTVINRFATLMDWLISTQDAFKSCTLDTLQSYIKLFIAEEYDVLSAYVQHLSQHKHYQPATVVGHIDDIRIACTWFVLFRTKNVVNDTRMKQPELLGFLTTAKHLRRILHKKVQYNTIQFIISLQLHSHTHIQHTYIHTYTYIHRQSSILFMQSINQSFSFACVGQEEEK